MAMVVVSSSTTIPKGGGGGGGGISGAYVGKAPPPPPGFEIHNGNSTRTRPPPFHEQEEAGRAVEGIVVGLRAAAAAAAFVGVALVASCRHGDWMEFTRYQEYRYLLGASLLACLYSAAQALRSFQRIRISSSAAGAGLLLDFAGDQVVAYLLITAASAALPITMRMRSAVVNIFTDAMVAAISLAFAAFAALAFSATISAFRLSAAAAQPY
ncbi:unnamed protein product [Urochloa humidicola]